MKISWSKADFFGSIAELRQRPFLALIGTAAGLSCGLITSWLDHISMERTSVLQKVPASTYQDPMVVGLVGIAVLAWLMGAIQMERKGAAVFVFSFFGGSILALLAIGIGRALAASPLW